MRDRIVEESTRNILVNKILTTMRERGQSPLDASNTMEVGYSYFMAMLRGERKMADASKVTLAKIARYLHISTVQSYFWAGALIPEDFLVEADADALLDQTYQSLLKDSKVAHLAIPVSEWNNLARGPKLLIAALYGMAIGNEVLPAAELPDSAQQPPSAGSTSQATASALKNLSEASQT